jgi:hypothetical protein
MSLSKYRGILVFTCILEIFLSAPEPHEEFVKPHFAANMQNRLKRNSEYIVNSSGFVLYSCLNYVPFD